ncbi:MAG: hypothetical protein AABX85_01375 [Nanoarchaeota archaeon]
MKRMKVFAGLFAGFFIFLMLIGLVSAPRVDFAFWANASSGNITEASLNQTVKMIANTSNIPNGAIIDFIIYNLTGGAVLYINSSVVSGDEATITDTVSNLVWGGAGGGAYINFNARHELSGTQANSENLKIINIFTEYCVENSNRWYTAIDVYNLTTDPNNLCLVDGVADSIKNYSVVSNNDCCSFGFMCTNQTDDYGGPEYKCANCTTTYLSESGRLNNIILCSDYNKLVNVNDVEREALCRADCADAAKKESLPFGHTNPHCEWISGKCVFVSMISSYGCSRTIISEGMCSNETGTRLITYINNKTLITDGGITFVPENLTNPECPDGSVEIPCRRSVVSLPFFGPLQLIIALAIVVILYIIISKSGWFGKKKKKRK